MRRYFTFVVLLVLALPVGISISGCTSNPGANYCSNVGYGVKKGTVYTISLTPVSGVSLAYGQTSTITTPTAQDCTGASASASSYVYQTDNVNVADISPSGQICAGTWNKFPAGGTPAYTICTAPTASVLASASNPVYLWASAAGVSSNKIPVYIHPALSSLQLSNSSTDCVSQGATQTLQVTAYTADSSSKPYCTPTPTKWSDGTTIPACSSSIGAITYSVVNSAVASVDSAGTITAKAPGSTAVTGTLSGVSSTAGYFTTCPAQALSLTLSDGTKSGTITSGVSNTLVSTATDKNGTTISGLTLEYTSTNPANVSVTSAGKASTTYPGVANIFAYCTPSSCNPSPLDHIGLLSGTGQPIVSNSVQLTASGNSSNYLWVGSPGNSQYFVPVNLAAGSVGSPVRLPYMPNSMVLDQTGTNLYFGSYRELMTYSASSNTLSSEDTNVPGVVLAVSPDNSQVLINDQDRQVFYLYTVSGKTYTTYGGIGAKAAYAPDGKTLYIIGPKTGAYANTLFVYNTFTGWHTYSNASDLVAAGSGGDLTVMNPHIGAYLAGSTSTVARSYCWTNSATATDSTTGTAYPTADTVAVATDHVFATKDGKHVLGAALSTSGTTTLTDISVNTINPNNGVGVGKDAVILCPNTAALTFGTSALQTPLSITASSVNQVLASADSSVAFVTYSSSSTTAGAALPYYKPGAAGSLGTLGTVTLAGSATAPVTGVFSPNDKLFFVGTSGDNQVHYIDTSTLTDTTQIDPKLVDANGNAVTPTVIWAFPRTVN